MSRLGPDHGVSSIMTLGVTKGQYSVDCPKHCSHITCAGPDSRRLEVNYIIIGHFAVIDDSMLGGYEKRQSMGFGLDDHQQ